MSRSSIKKNIKSKKDTKVKKNVTDSKKGTKKKERNIIQHKNIKACINLEKKIRLGKNYGDALNELLESFIKQLSSEMDVLMETNKTIKTKDIITSDDQFCHEIDETIHSLPIVSEHQISSLIRKGCNNKLIFESGSVAILCKRVQIKAYRFILSSLRVMTLVKRTTLQSDDLRKARVIQQC
jgi:hypothetical protein